MIFRNYKICTWSDVYDSTYIEWGDPDRFFGGIALLKSGKAQKLLYTGGKMPWNKAKENSAKSLKGICYFK
jgi:hypothetical protein